MTYHAIKQRNINLSASMRNDFNHRPIKWRKVEFADIDKKAILPIHQEGKIRATHWLYII